MNGHDKVMDRREFGRWTSAALGGLLTGGMANASAVLGQDGEDDSATQEQASEPRLVRLGLNALARAHTMNAFLDGHRGASLVAAHLLCVDNDLDKPGRSRIEQLFDLNWAPTALCQPFPEADPKPAQIDSVGETLAEGAALLRGSGHNAIFAALAVKALRLLPAAATPERIEGVCALVRAIRPDREERQRIQPDADLDLPPFAETAAVSKVIMREATQMLDKWVDFGQGITGHVITFGQALVELAAMGHVEWAESCRSAYLKYITRGRHGPQSGGKRYPNHGNSRLRPTMTEYWKRRGDHAVDIGHVFKYPYSAYDLLRRADDPALTAEFDRRAYLLF